MTFLGIMLLLVIAGLLTTVRSQQPMVVPSTISAGQPFSVYCGSNYVNIPGTNVDYIDKLQVLRNVSTDNVEKEIVLYKSIVPSGKPDTVKTIPTGRNWNITCNGSNGGNNNINTMRCTWIILDASCSDAGTYICRIYYTLIGGSDSSVSRSVQVTATAGTSQFELTVDPPPITPEQYVYDYGQNLTFTCSVNGPNTITFKWELWIDGVVQPDPIDGTINVRPTQSPISTGGCAVYVLQSTLTLQYKPTGSEEIYKCIVLINSAEVASGNITIGTSGSTMETPNSGAQSGDAGPNVGMIVGIVIGCVALIAIIIIVIFVVRYRKRSKESNYKAREDQPDVGRDNNLHAPPPVFPTSKSSKEPKPEKDGKIFAVSAGMTNEALDNSYDSRDSNFKMPPRYTNTDDTQAPPRYEKESHRGRSNRGYDDEDRDRNGGHGRSHKQPREPREHEERRHRSRGNDDGSRHHKYTPEDGTVGYNFGDPDMGTSI